MANGNPEDKKADQKLKALAKALQKIDLESRLIENMRHFEGTNLSEAQKLKIYEVLLKTLSQIQRGQKICGLPQLRTDCPQEQTQSWRQKVELQRGAWTAFALLLGAVVASTDTCELWLHTYGLRIGVYLQMLEDIKKFRNLESGPAIWMQSACENASQSQKISNQVSQELCTTLTQLRNDLSDKSLAYQFLNDFSLQWAEIQEDQAH